MHLVDPRKIIKAPYSQGDVVVFGQNAGQQCVAMSLCALIYHNMKGIGNLDELKQIMEVNSTAVCHNYQDHHFLLLADLPSMLTVLEEDYQLEYSESYLSNVHGEPTTEGYQYCMGLKRAFESLISEQYRSYILTVGCISVGISCCVDNGHF